MTRPRTYGHSETAGHWTIDLGHLDTSVPEHLNRQAEEAARAFLRSFTDVCTVEHAEGDIAKLGDDGRVSAFWPELPLESDQGGRLRVAADAVPEGLPADAFLSRVMLICAVSVEGDDEQQRARLSDAMYFQYYSGISSVVGEPAQFDSAHVSVSIEVDPWLDAPLQGGRFQDNRVVASVNRPRLERALRSWEAAMGRPITEVDSNGYPSFVDRYGFRPGGQQDPE